MQIDEIYSNLGAVREVFRQLILTTNYKREGSIITWPNYRPGFAKDILYAKQYEDLVNDGQYSFLLFDKSLLQFYYEFDSGSLLRSKLAYFPFPIKCRESSTDLENYFDATGDDELARLYLQLLEFKEEIGLSNSSHIRIDYDDTASTHSKCHMQLGALNELRIPARIAVYPFLFVEFVIKNLFSSVYSGLIKQQRYREVLGFSLSRCFSSNSFQETNYFLTIEKS